MSADQPVPLPSNPLSGLRADLHIHSVLSPCTERDMTPGNIVGMAMVLELDVIAITDHQSCGNCAAAMAITEALGGPLVIAGMEAESAEEIHLLCLFPDLAAATVFEAELKASQPFRPNRKEIFGEQWYVNENDEHFADEERMLLMPSQLTCDAIAERVLSLDGVCIPAHLDREVNSMLVTLGTVPPAFPAQVIELSRRADPSRFFRMHPELAHFQYISNSDAHRLEAIAENAMRTEPSNPDDEQENFRTRSRITAKDIIQALRPRLS